MACRETLPEASLGSSPLHKGLPFSKAHYGRLASLRELAISPAIECSPRFALVDASPLLEEKRHASFLALVFYSSNPLCRHRPSTRPTLATDDYPVNPPKVDVSKVLE